MEYIFDESMIDSMMSNLGKLNFTEEDQKVLTSKRSEFVKEFPSEKIKSLKQDEYFQGMGRKEGCFTYHLEWATSELGGIRGGSKYKFGYEEDFDRIKGFIYDLLTSDMQFDKVYRSNGDLNSHVDDLIKRTKEIKGIQTGRTSIGKILSIYFPETFINIFTDQEHFLNKLYNNYSPETKGLELYIKNNLLLHNAKSILQKRLSEKDSQVFTNDKFSKLLYFVFPKEREQRIDVAGNEDAFEALEVQHYQTLIHKNFDRLFPKLKYFDPENQTNGHYDTQEIGIMDFLCVDENNNFVIIELKRKATDQTLGQILRYMGWVKENLSKKNKVLGLILADRFDIKMKYAINVVDNITLKQIRLDISII